MDYGFHAPTVSFPSSWNFNGGTNRIEDLAELDCFCNALISIRKEIEASTKEDSKQYFKKCSTYF